MLNEQNQWIDYREIPLKKSSELLHITIYQMLQKNDLTVENIQSLFTIAGPGSYTGVRLAEGFAQVFSWQKITIFSCCHFEIPRLLGIKRGIFLSQAFKREVFVYKWNENISDKKNLPDSQFDMVIKSMENIGYPLFAAFNDKIFSGFNMQFTDVLLRENIERIFTQIKTKKMRSPIYYYRHLEREYSSSLPSVGQAAP
ncbi:MAG: hypothetical protein OXB84_07605 [Halobacteriovoraceae bacterium]|nr:hypothetical protein [Halobacteriovoraceae bacterium]